MKRDVLAHLWRIDITEADMAVIRWIAAIMVLVLSVSTLYKLQAGEIMRSLQPLGGLVFFAAYAVGPQCWRIIEAAEGSDSRKALTLIALFGALVYLSATIVDISRW